MISGKIIGRLSLYRRLLTHQLKQGSQYIYSHQLASQAGVTAAQVRRDIMTIGYSGNPNRGYDVEELIESIAGILDTPEGEDVALVGVGNLGRALIAYFAGRRPKLSIVAAFDNDPEKYGRVILGCRCYSIDEMPARIREMGIKVAIISVPAEAASEIADTLSQAGVTGILNFAPLPLQAPGKIHVENIDVTMSLEKVVYFARNS